MGQGSDCQIPHLAVNFSLGAITFVFFFSDCVFSAVAICFFCALQIRHRLGPVGREGPTLPVSSDPGVD